MHWSCLRNPSLRMTRPFDLRKRFSSVLNSLSLSLSLSLSHFLFLSLCLWYEQQRMHKSGDISVTSKFCLQNFFSLDERTWKKIAQGIKKSIKTISFQTDSQLLLFFLAMFQFFCTRVIALTLFGRWKDISAQSVNMRSFSLETWMSSWAVWGETSLIVAALAQDAGLA